MLGSNNLWGAEKIAVEICKNLTQEGFDIIYTSPDGPIRKTLEEMGVEYVALSSLKPGIIRKIADDYKPDIIHAHDNKASLISYIAVPGLKKKPIIVSHIHNSYPYLKKTGLHKLVDSIFRTRYSANIFCSGLTRDYYMKHAPYFNRIKGVIVMDNFTDVKFNNSRAGEGVVFSDKDKFRIGFIGRLEYQKGLDAFLSELKLQKSTLWEHTMIHVVGKGSMKDMLIELSNGLNIKFEGYCENPYEWMKSFDLLILPSRYEGLPLTVLEAMSVGTPILAMATGAIPEIIEDGVNGWTCESGDYKAFVRKLEYLVRNKKLIDGISLAAKRFIDEKYDKNTYMDKLKELYTVLTNERFGT